MQSRRAAIRLVFASAALCFLAAASFGSEASSADGSKWPSSRVRIAVSSSIKRSTSVQGDLPTTLERSVSLWSSVSDLTFSISSSDLLSVSPKGLRGDGVSLITIAETPENLSLFPREQNSPAAITRVFTDARGRITEADIVLNPFVRFSTDGGFATYDLQEILTHEIGHLLGLSHSEVWGSVMVERSSKNLGPADFAGARRSLPAVDAAAVRSIYGSKADDFTCCGSVSGKISGAAGSPKVSVWVEELGTGRMVASGTGGSGNFLIEGIPEGDYIVRSFVLHDDGKVSSTHSKVSVSPIETTKSDLVIPVSSRGINVELLGTSFQLGRSALRVTNETSGIAIGVDGPLDQVARVGIAGTDRWFNNVSASNSWRSQSVKVIQFDANAIMGLSSGEYTIVLEDVAGIRTFLPGSIVVR